MKSIFFYLAITLTLLAVSFYINRTESIPNQNTYPKAIIYSVSSFDPKTSKAENQLFQSLSQDQMNNLDLRPTYVFIPSARDNSGLQLTNGNRYTSPFGREELNQNVREICAFLGKKNNYQWLHFIYLINQNCNLDNINVCWQAQAEEANYSSRDLINCFTNQAGALINQSLATSVQTQLDAQSIINHVYDQTKR